jgi:hypothetical protein
MKSLTTTLFVFLSLFFTIIAYAQNELPEFGTPSMEELLMKECSFDKDAPAMKLIDFCESEFTVDKNIKIQTERRIRIKIFNERGYSYANIQIPYNGRKKVSKITDISAYIYSIDPLNKITIQKIEKRQIFKDKSAEGVSTIAFTFPNLKPGSVIEYRYKKTDKNTIHFEPWFFQDRIPTLHSICKIIKPSSLKLDNRFITYDSVKRDYSVKYPKYTYPVETYTYSLSQIPSFRLEPMMTSVKDNLQRMEFALTPSFGFVDFSFSGNNKWRMFNSILSKAPFFGGLANKKIPGTDSIINSAKRFTSFSDKVNFIYETVKSKISWDESQTFYVDDELENVWKEGVGNSAEINFILLNLLRKLEIESYPILVSTRENGKPDKEFLSFSQFDGVDVLLKDSVSTYFILDGTQKYQSYKIPPLNILNRDVFIVDSDSSKWVSVYDARPLLKTTSSANGFIDKEGVMTGEAFLYHYDLMKSQHMNERNRKKLDEYNEEEEEKDFIEKYSNDIKVDSITEKDADDALKPLTTNFKYRYKLSQTEDYYFLDPFFLASFRKNPFTDTVRTTEIDFGANQYYGTSIYLEVPENFDIAELPTNKLLRMPDSSMMFRRLVSRENDKILFRNTFEFYRSVFYPEEYPMVREFFIRMYGFINEPIVLKKKK